KSCDDRSQQINRNKKYKNIYNRFKPAQHRGNRQQSKKKSFADAVKGKNQSRPGNNNGNNRTPNPNLQNGTTSGGSMHDNQLVDSQLHQVRQMMTELQSMFKGLQAEVTALNRKVDDRIKNKSVSHSPVFKNLSSPNLIDGGDDEEKQEMDYDPSTHDNEAVCYNELATTNLKSLTSDKQQYLLNMLENQNIHICGISETWRTQHESNLLYKNDNRYQAFFSAPPGDQAKGSSTGIIVSADYARFIQDHKGFKGRVMKVDFFMRGNQKLRVIQIYGYSGHNKKDITELWDHVIKLIKDAQQQHYKLIIMGDFNINYHKFLLSQRKPNYKPSYKQKLLHFLTYSDNLVDTIPLYHDVTNDNPYNTHKNNSGHHTRIDYIWISQDLVNDTYASDQFNPQYSTDHMVVYVEFWTNNYFKLPSHAKQRQRNRQKMIYMYDDMSQDDWLEFSQHTKHLCEFRHLFEDEVDDVYDLNRLWDDTQHSIKEAANTYIKYRQTTSKKDGHPLRFSLLYRNIRFLQKLVIRLTNKKFLHNELRTKLQDDWFCIKAKLFEITGTYESEINLDGFLTNINLAANRKQIKTLCRSLMALFSTKMQEYNEEQMKNFISKRCEDFIDNKKAMINSIAEREIRTIVLDRIVHESFAGTTLVTDPVQIRKLTNNHFQLCPGAVNQNKPIPDQWKNQYNPLPHIDQDIYNNIMDPPSWDEWVQSPIQILNDVIQDAKKEKKDLWILSQDLSKAYDHVNIHILRKAMVRLRIPENFIELVLSLFTNRKNSASYKDNIYDLQSNIINQHISLMAYMDDTQWLSESKDNLEKILEIADDFYNFTDIQINKQKSELLLRIQNPNFKYNDDIQLHFGNQQIAIKPVHPSQSVRILGVWFNMNCS
ncbi:11381_t:CDS:2, partial [Rhizophagus irregularis]